MNNIRIKVDQILKEKGLTKKWLSEQTGIMPGNLNRTLDNVSLDNLQKIAKALEIDANILLSNEKNSGDSDEDSTPGKNLIPLYDDIRSVGGYNDITASTGGVSSPSDYIDAGDWFTEATAAVRHYGDSMLEYPPGCILAIKAVLDRNLILPGHDYVIETNEYRITKKIQLGEDYIRAYSTNTEKYEDGTLIHQPFNIPLASINRMFLVLGYVVKKNGGSIIVNAVSR